MARYPLAWQVTAFMGLQSFLYYATLSWFPTMFRDRGASAAHAGDLLALMNLGNAVTAMLLPVLAHRARDQRVLVAASTAATTAGLAGAGFAPLSTAAAWVLLLGLGQGATLGLGIFLTMARAPDPATAASLSGFAQGGGYLLAATGPLLRRLPALDDRGLGGPDRGAARDYRPAGEHRLAGRPQPDCPAVTRPATPHHA